MKTQLTWFGHGCWQIKTGGKTILLDPFLDNNPASPVQAADVHPDYILVSHGHYDHIADAAAIAKRTGATVISVFEIAQWLTDQHQVQHTLGMNLGGGTDLPFGRVKLTIAHHSSQLPDGSNGGNPAGFLLTLADGKIYFACDTALFADMQLIGSVGIDLAVLPIGDLFTMGPDDALAAINMLVPKRVAPAHYNTWPPIAQDAEAWAARVRQETAAEPVIVPPGGSFFL